MFNECVTLRFKFVSFVIDLSKRHLDFSYFFRLPIKIELEKGGRSKFHKMRP